MKASQAKILILSALNDFNEQRPSKHDFVSLQDILNRDKVQITDMDFARSVINSLYEDKHINIRGNNPNQIGLSITETGITFLNNKKNTVLKMLPYEFIEKMENDIPTWFEKMNITVGLTSLGFASLAFKSDYPELLAWCFIIVVFGVSYSLRHYFPQDLKRLRKKDEKTILEKVILRGVESEFLRFKKVIFDGFVFWVGLLSLFAVASGFKTLLLIKILPLFKG